MRIWFGSVHEESKYKDIVWWRSWYLVRLITLRSLVRVQPTLQRIGVSLAWAPIEGIAGKQSLPLQLSWVS